MRVAVAVLCVVVTAFLQAECFVVFRLPRRAKRDPRIARGTLRSLWKPWRAVAGRLPTVAGDTMLGVFGPLGLLTILGVLSAGVVLLRRAVPGSLDAPRPPPGPLPSATPCTSALHRSSAPPPRGCRLRASGRRSRSSRRLTGSRSWRSRLATCSRCSRRSRVARRPSRGSTPAPGRRRARASARALGVAWRLARAPTNTCATGRRGHPS